MEGLIITSQVIAQNDFQSSFSIYEIPYKCAAEVMSVINHQLYLSTAFVTLYSEHPMQGAVLAICLAFWRLLLPKSYTVWSP